MIKAIPVYQYDLDGNFIAEYGSVNKATKATGINCPNISRVCTGSLDTEGTRRHMAGGYQWSYKKVEKMKKILTPEERFTAKAEQKIEESKMKEKEKAEWVNIPKKPRKKSARVVIKDSESYYQYSMDGTYIRSFENAEEVMEYIGNGYNKKVLARACTGILPCAYGFQWRYYKENEIDKYQENTFY